MNVELGDQLTIISNARLWIRRNLRVSFVIETLTPVYSICCLSKVVSNSVSACGCMANGIRAMESYEQIDTTCMHHSDSIPISVVMLLKKNEKIHVHVHT